MTKAEKIEFGHYYLQTLLVTLDRDGVRKETLRLLKLEGGLALREVARMEEGRHLPLGPIVGDDDELDDVGYFGPAIENPDPL